METSLNVRIPCLSGLLLASLALAACSTASDSEAPAATAESSASAAAAGPAAAEIDPGLIADPRFEIAGVNVPLQHWKLYQHAGDASFEMRIESHEVSLRRIGVEPWGTIEQAMPADALVGKTLEWSAELWGELGEARGEAFDASGLAVTVMGFGPHDLPMMGARHLLTQSSEPPLSTGPVTRQRYAVRFVVPEGRELELKLALQLTRDGELRMRAPSLRVIEDTAAP